MLQAAVLQSQEWQGKEHRGNSTQGAGAQRGASEVSILAPDVISRRTHGSGGPWGALVCRGLRLCRALGAGC